jgi:hypothetical protein
LQVPHLDDDNLRSKFRNEIIDIPSILSKKDILPRTENQAQSTIESIEQVVYGILLDSALNLSTNVFMAWTVECSNIDTGSVQTTPTPSGGVTDLPSARVNVRVANLREGPGLNYVVITSLAQDSMLTVLEKTDASDPGCGSMTSVKPVGFPSQSLIFPVIRWGYPPVKRIFRI